MSTPIPQDAVSLTADYRLTAVIYWESSKLLRESFCVSGTEMVGNRMAIPFYYLVSHAMELLLKCALLKRGHIRQDLMKPTMRHSLQALLAEVEGKNGPVTKEARTPINAIGDQHGAHDLRYNFLNEGTTAAGRSS